MPFFDSEQTVNREIYWEHEGNRAIRGGEWKLVGQRNEPWELYHIAKDRTELNDLADHKTNTFAALKAKWDTWASDVGVLTPAEFERIRKEVRRKNK